MVRIPLGKGKWEHSLKDLIGLRIKKDLVKIEKGVVRPPTSDSELFECGANKD